MIRQFGEDQPSMFEEMFLWLTSRRPNTQQLAVVTEMYQQQFEYFSEHPESAEEYLAVGDAPRDDSIEAPRLAAAAVVAGALFNYDVCVIQH